MGCGSSNQTQASSPVKQPSPLAEYPKWEDSNKSLLRKYLTQQVFDQLKTKKTSKGFQLKDLIRCGVINQDTNIGLYAGDAECFKVFAPLMTPIIEDLHKPFKVDKKCVYDLDDSHLALENADPDKAYLVQTWISVARNLKGYSLTPGMTLAERLEVEKKVAAILPSLGGDLTGQYYPLGAEMDEATKEKLAQDLKLFKPGNPLLESAGINRDFPQGRGTYVADSKLFRVWVNEEDHVRVISMLPGGDIQAVLERLQRGVKELSSKLDFQCDDHLGFLTACPSLLGSGMRLLFIAKLPNAVKHANFATICQQYRVDCRGFNGADLYAVAAKGLLGQTEVERIANYYEAVKKLIEMDKEMAA